jgi:large-conductance mechanosensitive channel
LALSTNLSCLSTAEAWQRDSVVDVAVAFVMVGVVMFFVIKAYGRFRADENALTTETTNELLASIRDELRNNRVE